MVEEGVNIKVSDRKIVGYTLLVIGLCIISYSVFSVLTVFNGDEKVPIEILHSEGTTGTQQTIDLSSGTPSIPIDFTQIMTPLFPAFNVLIWIAIAFFLVSAGARIALIGVKLIDTSPNTAVAKTRGKEKDKQIHMMRKEKVEEKEEDLKEQQSQ